MAWKAKLAMNGKVLHRNPIRVGWGRPVPSKVRVLIFFKHKFLTSLNSKETY